jgi:peptidoglycan/xylan/chitin deacetylase (PgdA/CDA1 family)
MSATLPRRLFLTDGPRHSRQVCLTFDDGPHPDYTPRLLQVLAELEVKATFFMIGREADRYPQIVRRISAEGHEVGNHSWSHYDSRSIVSADFMDEVQRTSDVLARLTGRPCCLFRPPHGKLTPAQLVRAWMCRQTVALWNQDPKDYACRSPGDLTAFFDAHPARGGSIVLLHDNQPHAVDALPAIVAGIRARDLSFTTLDGWLSMGRPVPGSAVA